MLKKHLILMKFTCSNQQVPVSSELSQILESNVRKNSYLLLGLIINLVLILTSIVAIVHVRATQFRKLATKYYNGSREA